MANHPLEEAATYFYEAAGLHGEVHQSAIGTVQSAFLTSDCEDFAWMLSRITGWPMVRVSWTVDGHPGHHTLVRTPYGSLVDVTGKTTLEKLRETFGNGRRLIFSLTENVTHDLLFDAEIGQPGDFEHARMIALVIANLPYAPFSEHPLRERALELVRSYEQALADEDDPEPLP